MSCSSCENSVSEDSQPQRDVVYPLNEEIEVPDTNGGLFKKVLVEGTGSKPVKGAKVSVHYVGTLEDGTKFDSSRDRGDLFEFALGKGQVIKGWDKGVATMRIGEKAVLRCSPDYGYGAAGSPPKIPANATLLFEVELFSWTREVDVSKAKDRSLMKDVLADGVDYENPSFETKVVMDVAVYSGAIDTSKPLSELPPPVWEKKQWEATLGEVELPPRLEECLHSMRNKESAAFRVKGSLVPDAVPAFHIPSAAERKDADVTYLVEMHAMHSVKSWEFEGEAKIAEGLARKDKGNAALKENRLDLAERYYRRALEFVGEDYGLKDECKPECHKARIAVCGNLTQVLLQKAQYNEALTFCEKVLALDPANAKALFRFAKAKDALQDWDAAAKAVDKILEGDANNADAIALKQHITSEKKAYDQKQKSLFKKMFS